MKDFRCYLYVVTEPRGRGRPATGRDPVRTIRMGALWDEARAAAKANRLNILNAMLFAPA